MQRTGILTHRPMRGDPRGRHPVATVAVGALSISVVLAAFGFAPSSSDLPVRQSLVVDEIALIPPPVSETQEHAFVSEERIHRGDTLGTLFERLGIDDPGAVAQLRNDPLAARVFRELRAGKWVMARTDGGGVLHSVVLPLGSRDRSLVIEREGEQLKITEQPLATETHLQMRSGEIRSSLFAAADDVGLPDAVAIQIAEIFASDIDFHRDLRKGDRFSVVYEARYHQGVPVGAGRVVAAEFANQGKVFRAIFFEAEAGKGGYYTEEGKSLRKAFLRSPIEFSRVTSGFSMRFHPILQKWRAHKGVDYGAPVGTRVRATGDGIVEFAGRKGGYGNVVILRHQSKYTTLYGHLKGFASGVRAGARVSQGDPIGYVGMTGLTTGPHLHYEFRVGSEHKNPLSIIFPQAQPLSPQALESFRATAGPMLSRLELLGVGQLAALFD